jgi:hypothetical protein
MLFANLFELCSLRLGEIQLTERNPESTRTEPITPATTRPTTLPLGERDHTRGNQPNHRNRCCH